MLNIRTKKQIACFLEKYASIILFVLVPCSCLFAEFLYSNIYIINGCLIFLLVFFTVFNLIKNKTLYITSLEIILFLIICSSFLSAIIKSQQIQVTIYMSFLLYWSLLLQTKSSIKKVGFSKYLCITIIFTNILTLILLSLSYYQFGDYRPYIERHFGNTGIYAILLAISTILMFYLIIFYKKKSLFLLFFIIFLNIGLIINLQSRLAISLIIISIAIILFSNFKYLFFKLFKIPLIIFVGCVTIGILTFFFKADSTQGRWLILKISTDIIKNNFFIGSGGFNTFSLNYPLYQAKYFSTNSVSEKEILLADNTKYVFNEFIQFFTENGFLGIILILFVLWISYKILRAGNLLIKIFALCLFIASHFFYICHIAIFQTLLFLMFVYLASNDKIYFKINFRTSKILSLVILLICLSTIHKMYNNIIYSLELEKLFYQNRPLISKGGIIEDNFRDNPMFLGLYAYELYQNKRFTESLKILNSVENIYIHSDLLALKAKILFKLGNIHLAEMYFIKATEICPNRFRYKHDLFKFYLNTHNSSEAKKVASQIIILKEKVPSTTTLAIKQEAKRYLADLEKNINLK